MPSVVLIIVAAVFLSFVGVIDSRVIAVVATACSLVGIAVTFLWWSMVFRSRKYYSYWIASARELEKQLIGTVKTLEHGQKLTDTQVVDEEHLVFKRHERIRVSQNLNAFYLTFLVVFVLLLVWNILRVVRAF
ncbi:MAG: hypothetical protein AB7P69_10185 [Candidatus Binatia bacterium]